MATPKPEAWAKELGSGGSGRDSSQVVHRRTKPGEAMPSKTPSPFMGGGVLIGDLVEEVPPAQVRKLRSMPTMHSQDLAEDAIDPELRKLADNAILTSLEGQVGELLTKLKRVSLLRDEDSCCDAMSDMQSLDEDPTMVKPFDALRFLHVGTNAVASQDLHFGAEPISGPLQLQVGERTPDFARHSRLTPLLLECRRASLGGLSKDEIRGENHKLREEIAKLRLEIHLRQEEIHSAGAICCAASLA